MPTTAASERCPHCGTRRARDDSIEGLCPSCLLGLALLQSPPDLTRGGPDAPTIAVVASGRVLGDRYQVLELLGRGGMGEVYRAFDLKLRVDVALKAVRTGHAWTEQARELLRREVRSAREVVSPNVCRIFDLVDQEGEELLSMEYIDGETLGETLRARGPLVLSEAREIASQFLSGLEAIHRAGLVHRDFKPENVMITRAGRVVVMDFGVAGAAREGPARTISGTPAYMAPEQARGEEVDARADVFSAGIVLAEMISVGGRDLIQAREALWRAVRSTPPAVPDGPWAAVLRRALASRPGERYASARELARGLEEVTLRVPGFDERRPYPGLQSFTEQDAEYFFGREIEVESVWKKLNRPRLLGLIGPSGAGKSSFVRAGLLPALPASWKAVVTAPGTRPFQALAQALVPQFAGDTEALQALVRFEDADTAVAATARWRSRHEHTLVIVDQFEELFTQNEPAVQAAFANLLGRLVLEADTHVILSLRDDFLVHCHAHEALAPMLSDLTILGPLGESGLRRALVQPALSCGYRFEDEALVEEMIHEVATERGALPLLAFAASRLWDTRDREKGVLTWAAYREIGGVAGALARHAESTLERIGAERIPIVRELFRNLVTSQGTRAVRGRDDLLSIFARDAGPEARSAAETVLNVLIDARLLTTYERPGDEGERVQQIEIIHESLLSAWPRLVRWRTQDADGAQLRDQLRQAAQLWHERGRSEDLLWSGIAYRDFALWRERYPGRLSANEEAFAEAAKRRTERRRRRRRQAGAALITAVALVAVTMAVLWRQSEVARRQATAESLRAEAGRLTVMGERELLRYPTGALAYVMKGLELADTESGRLLALRLLQQAPVARIARVSEGHGSDGENWAGGVDFSPTGDWVGWGGRRLLELARRDGQRLILDGYSPRAGLPIPAVPAFSLDGKLVVANHNGDIRVWSIPDGRERYRGSVGEGASQLAMGDGRFFTLTKAADEFVLHEWPLTGASPRRVGTVPSRDIALSRAGVAYVEDHAVYYRPMSDWNAPARRLFEQPTAADAVAVTDDGSEVASGDREGTIRIGPTDARAGGVRQLKSPEPILGLGYGAAGRWLVAGAFQRGYPSFRLFDLASPPGTEPLLLQKGDTTSGGAWAFDPAGRWFVTAHGPELAFWPLTEPRARIFRDLGAGLALMFAPDGRRIIYLRADRTVRTLPMDGHEQPRVLLNAGILTPLLATMAMDPSGRIAAVTGGGGRVLLLRLDDGAEERLDGFPAQSRVGRAAFSPDGRLLAAGMIVGPRDQKVIRVWNRQEKTSRAYGPLPGAGDSLDGGIYDVAFAGPERLLAAVRGTGLVSVDLVSGATRVVVAQPVARFVLSPDGRFGVASRRVNPDTGPGDAIRFSLDGGTARELPHGSDVRAIAMDPSGSLVATGSRDGSIRVSRTSGDAPAHLLLGQESAIYSLSFSPDGKWLAACGEAFDIRVWPVPDVSKPPIHLLPRDTLLNLLRSHTNLRAVLDAAAPGGYALRADAFPGWATLPEW